MSPLGVSKKTLAPIFLYFSFMPRGKKYNAALKFVEAGKTYSVEEAVALLEKTNYVKFDPTVEIHFRLGIEPTKADQMIRMGMTLPHGTGKAIKIAAFTDAGDEKSLISGGALVAGGDDLISGIESGSIPLNFDIAIATPAMMRKMGKIAKVLGPKGLMPNPKSGTVGEDLTSILKELKGGKFEVKNDKQGDIHGVFGKLSFGSKKLTENLENFIQHMKEARPTGLKSTVTFIEAVYVCTAMGPSIPVKI
jgi:large subunit ribosomal protein L1